MSETMNALELADEIREVMERVNRLCLTVEDGKLRKSATECIWTLERAETLMIRFASVAVHQRLRSKENGDD